MTGAAFGLSLGAVGGAVASLDAVATPGEPAELERAGGHIVTCLGRSRAGGRSASGLGAPAGLALATVFRGVRAGVPSAVVVEPAGITVGAIRPWAAINLGDIYPRAAGSLKPPFGKHVTAAVLVDLHPQAPTAFRCDRRMSIFIGSMSGSRRISAIESMRFSRS